MKVFCKASVILVTEPLFNINIIVSDFLNVIKISHQHFKSVSVWRSPLVTRQHISPPSSVTNNDIIILATLFILTHTLRIISRDSLSQKVSIIYKLFGMNRTTYIRMLLQILMAFQWLIQFTTLKYQMRTKGSVIVLSLAFFIIL